MANIKQSYGEARGELVRDLCSVGGWRVKSEVRRRIDEVVKIALEEQMKEVIDSLIDWADEKTDLQNEIIRDNFGSKDWNDGNINALHDIITHLKNLKSKELLTPAKD